MLHNIIKMKHDLELLPTSGNLFTLKVSEPINFYKKHCLTQKILSYFMKSSIFLN